MPATKRQSLCIDALSGPATFLGTTLFGWIVAPITTYLAFETVGYKAAIMAFIVLWFTPPIIAKAEPYLVTALLRNLFFAEFYDAD